MTGGHAQDRPRFLWVFAGLVVLFLLAPIVVVTVFSFNSHDSTSAFGAFSIRWYRAVRDDPPLLASLRVSIQIALATTVISTVLGTLLAFGLVRSRTRLTLPVEGVLLLTLVTPEVATGTALFLFFLALHTTLSTTTVIVGHVAFSVVFVVVLVRARLAALPREIEEASLDLGASEIGTILRVVLPQLWPAVSAAALLTFVFSFDDFVTSYFVTGVGSTPLPVLIYSRLKFGLTPELNAIGTIMIAVSVLLGVVAIALLRTRRSGKEVARALVEI